MTVARVAALAWTAMYLVAATLPCGAFGQPRHAVAEHEHADSAATPCHAPPQLDAPCPCGCDEDTAASVSGVRVGAVEPACTPAPDPVSGLRIWLAPGPRLPAEPDLGVDPVPV